MESAAKIKEILQAASMEKLPEFIAEYENDPRSGVQKLVSSAQKKIDTLEKERQRIENLKKYEKEYAQYTYIILPKDCDILYINDSKQLSEKKREELYDVITKEAVAWAVGYASPERIDEINILQATYEAMREAVGKLDPAPDLLLNDAVTIPGVEIRQVPIIKGDAKSISIGAASIVAKVTRDRLMEQYADVFPEYDFASNKGYGSAAHIAALKEYGPTPIHRHSFIKNFGF